MTATVLSPPTREASPRAVPVWVAIAAASLPMFMATLDNLVLTSALPVIDADLHASVTELSWFMNAFTLTFASLMLTAASLGDRLGRRRVMTAGIALFTLASIASALATTPTALIAARAIQGVGAAAIMPLSLTLLASAVPERLRPVAIGIWSGISGLGVALGPVIGGAVVEGISWQAIFWLNVPVAIVAIPLLRFAIRESTAGRRPRLDLVGTLLLGGAVFLGIWGIVHGNDNGWTAPSVLAPLVGAGLLVPGYLVWARRRADAVLPLRLFASRSFSAANAIGLLFTLGMFGAVFLLAQYLQVVMGYSPLEAGVRTLPWTAAPMVFAPLAGVLARRVGVRPLLLVGLAAQTAALAWFAALTESHAGYSSFVVPLLLAGAGMGFTFAPSATAVLDGLPDSDFAVASSANSTLREFGVAIGIAVLAAVFLANGGTLTPTGYDGAIGPALLTGAAALGAATVAALFIPGRRSAG
ncbi:MAG: DHA2 family efflux MFS transporter permease subunit [Intrasporangium sp.]|uniref:DHA2 family efflux MFS transporter permease subunit n=1 Tax=Intrasporangium sp. TaxID=1925024 RepID=UPI0026484F78|nr:DHA2 family efflux MFS transporter permease subunit [Intrasporangium sp.]MDN5797161.1 DHA2 family efflux MFS transporter permease subunit [Intrasporangium sp.]